MYMGHGEYIACCKIVLQSCTSCDKGILNKRRFDDDDDDVDRSHLLNLRLQIMFKRSEIIHDLFFMQKMRVLN